VLFYRSKDSRYPCRTCWTPRGELNDATGASSKHYRIQDRIRVEITRITIGLQAREYGTVVALREEAGALSMTPVINPWWDLPYGDSGGRGIHGATPFEMLHFYLLGMCLKAYNWTWEIVDSYCSKVKNRISDFDDRFRAFNVRHVDKNIFSKHYGYGVKDLAQIEAKEWRCLLYQLIACIGTTDKFIPVMSVRNKVQRALSLLLIYYDLIWVDNGHTEEDLNFIDRLTPVVLQAYKDAFVGL